MLVGTNWKMNKSRAEAQRFARTVGDRLTPDDLRHVGVFIIPPLTALDVVQSLSGKNIRIGVQNTFWEASGPYTGEISPLQAVDAGATIIEIGHSERRQLFGETEYTVAKKTLAAMEVGCTALVCVGEPKDILDIGRAREWVRAQVAAAVSLLPDDAYHRLWIAYEPMWAIGEGSIPATPAQAESVHKAIRMELASRFGSSAAAEAVPILYGGSVNLKNAPDFLSAENVGGLFVGRSALDADRFVEIVQLAAGYAR